MAGLSNFEGEMKISLSTAIIWLSWITPWTGILVVVES